MYRRNKEKQKSLSSHSMGRKASFRDTTQIDFSIGKALSSRRFVAQRASLITAVRRSFAGSGAFFTYLPYRPFSQWDSSLKQASYATLSVTAFITLKIVSQLLSVVNTFVLKNSQAIFYASASISSGTSIAGIFSYSKFIVSLMPIP